MFLFMFVLLPMALLYCCLRSSDKSVIGVALTGALSGVFVCGALALFTYLHRIPQFSFIGNTLYVLLKEYIIPVVLLYTVYFFATSDEKLFKIKSFMPLMLAFYSIYMPYRIIAGTDGAFSFYSLFVKPVCILAMIIYLAKMLFLFNEGLEQKNTKNSILSVLFIILAFIIPACMEGLYSLAFIVPVVYAVDFLYCLGALILVFCDCKKQNSFLL